MSESQLTVVVSGYVVRRPVGGLAWHYGQYVAGLRRLGHRVFYMEDSGDSPSCFNPKSAQEAQSQVDGPEGSDPVSFRGLGEDPSHGLDVAADFFEGLGCGDAWCFYDAHTGRWLGPAGTQARAILSEADVILNVSGGLSLRPWHMQIPKRVLIDTDPVFSQVRNRTVPVWLDRSLRHNVFLTFGENYGKESCGIPNDGLPWVRTRQPIVLDCWQSRDGPPGAPYTTVMSWKSYPSVVVDERSFGLKADAFAEVLSLPRSVGVEMELAIEAPERAKETLRREGWKTRDPLAVTKTPWIYRDYIQGSRGEFTVAKEAYAVSRSGWFSERSAAYLASGRPVICQDTGFSDWVPVGEGLLSFEGCQEAGQAISEVEGNWRVHSKRASEIASAYFSSDLVLTQMLDEIYAQDHSEIDLGGCPGREALVAYLELARLIEKAVPASENVILIDDMALGVDAFPGERRCLPFLERRGEYWGRPRDGAEAIAELLRMRGKGSRYVAVVEDSFWWLDFFEGLRGFLETQGEKLVDGREVVVYRLRRA